MNTGRANRWFLLSFFLVVSMSFVGLPALHAATIEVDTAVDELNGMSGNGSCSLREAIANANQNNGAQADCIAGSGADVITFNASLNSTALLLSIAGTGEDANLTGDLDITDDLTISGNGAAYTILDANNVDRVLHIIGDVTVTMSEVTLENGQTAVLGDPGGGIYNQGGTLTIQQSRITGNQAQNDVGGGVVNEDGTLTIRDSVIDNNATGLTGGGVINWNRTLNAAAVSADLINTTISGNQADDVGGGAVNASETDGTASLTLINSTVTANLAGLVSGGIDDGGGVASQGFGTGAATATLQNSIVAGNGSLNNGTWDCFASGTGSVVSNGHNLVGTAQGCPSGGSSDQTTATPNNDVSPTLADNGGPTLTHALPPSSLAIDSGDNTVCTAAAVNNLDQRGEPRPVDYGGGATCDVGAFERQTDETAVLTLNDGQTQSFGATMITITDNPGGNAPGLTTITRFNQAPGIPDAGEMPFQLSINAAVNSGLNVNLTICYTDSEIAVGTSVNEAALQLYRYNNATLSWDAMGVDTLDTAVNCATKNNVTGFSSWTLASAQPTAVSLQSGTVDNGSISLVLIILGLVLFGVTVVSLHQNRS